MVLSAVNPDLMEDDQPSKRRRRSRRAPSDRKFECTHEGCGKSYSRAEHLYRHQLNRTCANLKISSSPTSLFSRANKPVQIHQSRYSAAIFLTVTAPSSDRIFVSAIASDTPHAAHSCKSATRSPTLTMNHLKPSFRPLPPPLHP